MKLFLKGTRCDSPSAPIDRREHAARHARSAAASRASTASACARSRSSSASTASSSASSAATSSWPPRRRRTPARQLLEHPGAPAGQRRPPARLRAQPRRRPADGRATATSGQRPQARHPEHAGQARRHGRGQEPRAARASWLASCMPAGHPPPVPDCLEASPATSRPKAGDPPAQPRRRRPAHQDIREQLIIEFCDPLTVQLTRVCVAAESVACGRPPVTRLVRADRRTDATLTHGGSRSCVFVGVAWNCPAASSATATR